MSKPKLIRSISLICIVLCCSFGLMSCGAAGWKQYTIEEVSQALLDEGLISSMDMGLVGYPSGAKRYTFRNEILTLPEHNGDIILYPTRRELRSGIRNIADSVGKGPLTYSQFVKGNVVILVYPELSENDTERFRRALSSLK